MKFVSEDVFDSLRSLNAQLARYGSRAAQLKHAEGTGNQRLALEGMRTIATLYLGIRRQVVSADGAVMGEHVGSLGELGLRAQTLLVAAELSPLVEADAEWKGSRRGADGVRLLSAALYDELAGINTPWMVHARGDVRAAAPGESSAEHIERVARYHGAIRQAQRAIAAVGVHSKVASLLRAGIANPAWPVVHTACVRITRVLAFTLRGSPDLSLLERPAGRAAATTTCADAAWRKA
jgi:hypothetical protein